MSFYITPGSSIDGNLCTVLYIVMYGPRTNVGIYRSSGQRLGSRSNCKGQHSDYLSSLIVYLGEGGWGVSTETRCL